MTQGLHYDDRKRPYTVVYTDVNCRERQNYDHIRWCMFDLGSNYIADNNDDD